MGQLFPRILIVPVFLTLILLLLFGASKHLFLTLAAGNDKANSLNPISFIDSWEKPKLNQLTFHIQEFSIPGNDSIPLYPLYDKGRNVIWVGDTVIDSGRILEFNLNSTKYTEHKLKSTSIVTVMALDARNNRLWYVDPLLKHLGNYDPFSNTTKLYNIPTTGTISRIAIDLCDNVWLTVPDSNEVLKFDTTTNKFTILHLPTSNATPIGIAVNKRSGHIWIAESTGKKLAEIDPMQNYKVQEYYPLTARNNTLDSPTELFIDGLTNDVYVSEHDNHTVTVFDPNSKTFRIYPVVNPQALPFGMTMGRYGYLWVAEHVTNKITLLDPKTGAGREVQIPKPNPYVQFLTSDPKGNIWFAEQLGNSLGVITYNAKTS